jgi:hypothetical protein
LASDDNPKAGKRTEAFLARKNHDVDAPTGHLNIFTDDGTDGIEHNGGYGGKTLFTASASFGSETAPVKGNKVLA